MPGTDHTHQHSFLNRIRRNQTIDNNNNNEPELLEDLESFQKHVADRFSNLHLSTEPSPALSISWFRSLLDAFLSCEAEFKAVILSSGRDMAQFTRPPLDRLVHDLLDRSVKALDVCNAVTHGVDLVQHWQKLSRIAVSALRQGQVTEGQVRRARKALATMLASMALEDRENGNSSNFNGRATERTWSIGRRGNNNNKARAAGSYRTLSNWSVAKSWSASRQLQTMSANLLAPRGPEANGLATPVYVMSTVLVFVMWALVAAIPCQERSGLGIHFQIPRNLGWAGPIVGLQERIGEDWKKREKRGGTGLLEEMERMESVAHSLVEFADSFAFPLEEEKEKELAELVDELAKVCQRMEDGLGPLQQQIREVFHRIVRSRGEVLDVVDQVSKLSMQVMY